MRNDRNGLNDRNLSDQKNWIIREGNSPLIFTAIHSGHTVLKKLEDYYYMDEYIRFREEDPYTDILAKLSDNYIINNYSRYAFDVNRTRDNAFYRTPMDDFGMKIWKEPPPEEFIQDSLELYDSFYYEVNQLLRRVHRKFGFFLVLDFHSYNHRRNGPAMEPADPNENPDINLGTITVNKELWGGAVKSLENDFSNFDFLGSRLDTRENVRFDEGDFSKWINKNYPNNGCSIAVEFKKIFMDEWTGKLCNEKFEALYAAVKSTIPGLLKEIENVSTSEIAA
jgi:hypothetical protein